MPKHVKGRDKDRYYHLAKDQGFRARSAFKLIQIDKRYDILSKARVCIDLCAAPGGWCQVAARAMRPGSIIIGVDLLPIREIRNVKTIVADITTAECRSQVNKELSGWPADVILCDGAPNIGSDYSKDAYVQNELVLAALKTATDHLVAGGTFVSKVYRSKDYNSLMWVFQHFFEDVQAIKPNSSRSQSSEIFIVCLKYTKPKKIDPKMLDPSHVFQDYEDAGQQGVDVLHKKYDTFNKKKRSGYDESLGMTLRSKSSVAAFVDAKEPVQHLTTVNEMFFDEDSRVYEQHPSTTEEIKLCFQDLRVLGKPDFRKLLRWRLKLREELAAELRGDEDDDKEDTKEGEKERVKPGKDGAPLSDGELLQELSQIKRERALELRKEKKKERKTMAANRMKLSLGMTNKSFGAEEDDELFGIGQFDELEDVDCEFESGVRAEWDRKERLELLGDAEAALDADGNAIRLSYADRGALRVQGDDDLDNQLEQDYSRFLKGRRQKLRDGGATLDGEAAEMEDRTLSAKRARKAESTDGTIAAREHDDELIGIRAKRQRELRQGLKNDMDAYVAMLNDKGGQSAGLKKKGRGKGKKQREGYEGPSDSSSDDDDDDDDDGIGFQEGFAESDDEDEDDDDDVGDNLKDDDGEDIDHVKRAGLVSASDAAADRWFSNPFLKDIAVGHGDEEEEDEEEEEEEEEEEDQSIDKGVKPTTSRSRYDKKQHEKAPEDDDENGVLGTLSMPKTARELRKEKRKKDMERNERRAQKRADRIARESGQEIGAADQLNHFEVVRTGDDNDDDDDDVDADEETRAYRAQIRAGVGASSSSGAGPASKGSNAGFEVVPAPGEYVAARKDPRDYNSDDEEYDAHDRAMTLALGTMMLRKSRQKAMVDASYNRYAWNDPMDLPTWFTDDEIRHNRPQIPVPPALLAQVKGKFQHQGTKEIKKVAEARMRKRKKAMQKLKAAKKQATALAGNTEMTEGQKVRAIQKAMKGTTKSGEASKVYVVSGKTKAGSSATRLGAGKGKLKFVDKRLRSDQRALKRAEKKGSKTKKRKWH